MADIKFRDTAHRDFFLENMMKCRVNDCYHRAFLAPFLYGLYWKGVTRAGVWAGFITGVGLTVANMFFGFIKSPINAGAMAMIAGLLIVPFISLITPKLKKSEIEDVFICYDEKVTITKKHSLED